MAVKDAENSAAGKYVVWLNERAYVEMNIPEFLGRGVVVEEMDDGNWVCKFMRYTAGYVAMIISPEYVDKVDACNHCGGSGQVRNYLGVRTCLYCDGHGFNVRTLKGGYKDLPNEVILLLWEERVNNARREADIRDRIILGNLTTQAFKQRRIQMEEELECLDILN